MLNVALLPNIIYSFSSCILSLQSLVQILNTRPGTSAWPRKQSGTADPSEQQAVCSSIFSERNYFIFALYEYPKCWVYELICQFLGYTWVWLGRGWGWRNKCSSNSSEHCVGDMVVKWLELLTQIKKVLGLSLAVDWGHSVWCLHVLLLPVWVSSNSPKICIRLRTNIAHGCKWKCKWLFATLDWHPAFLPLDVRWDRLLSMTFCQILFIWLNKPKHPIIWTLINPIIKTAKLPEHV